ncbi:bacteriohopanetetrol glucosamine biosynthesis glycosyltransferase HpnI [Silvibacterium dinghuense]|uniref:Glycosyltransferase n=1 Tax=Silvibacterium dinghuense TaxID=1560006 RepID=A0A4V1NW27_9BACT|nr:bacteriohopanetetrol glucosamine biosynthesis glycosyltransferase HpnI [Silvibacterium dinghuense]RXS97962.1 glycosyltransferase [Silvibacterium dinghuense]GGH03394.1 ceramide glucosyltransferase [Silvibacterium dinghuense]
MLLAAILASLTTILTFAGLFYSIVALWGARNFMRRWRKPESFAPPVSILKPVKGFDPGMYEAFASHCRQQYAGDYEILFGAASIDDPAVAAIERLKAEFPEREIRLVLCPEVLGLNGKISNVMQIAAQARYDYLLVNDSDIHVSPRYLERIVSGFAHAGTGKNKGKTVGMVTAPYRGRSHGTLGSKLESLGISTDFFPGVLTALLLDGEIRFGLGSTLAVSREALDAMGGFAPLVDCLADDYELGFRIAQAGYVVELSHEVVETSVPAYHLRGFMDHQLRWARGIRDSRKAGYIGLLFTFVLPWALLNVVAQGMSLPSLALLSLSLLVRVTVALAIGVGILGDRQVLRDLWLLPLRDLTALWIWAWSFASNTVTWRGYQFTLRDGKLERQ